MKAVCVLEAMLRKSDDVQFKIVGQYFSENMDAVVKCSESPQASLREKSHKVSICDVFLKYFFLLLFFPISFFPLK